jgi:hypothetical protein
MRFSLHLYFASCRLLQHARKGCILRHLYIAALLQTLASTDVTFVYIVGTGVPDCPHQINLLFALRKNYRNAVVYHGISRVAGTYHVAESNISRAHRAHSSPLCAKKPWGYSQGFLR